VLSVSSTRKIMPLKHLNKCIILRAINSTFKLSTTVQKIFKSFWRKHLNKRFRCCYVHNTKHLYSILANDLHKQYRHASGSMSASCYLSTDSSSWLKLFCCKHVSMYDVVNIGEVHQISAVSVKHSQQYHWTQHTLPQQCCSEHYKQLPSLLLQFIPPLPTRMCLPIECLTTLDSDQA